MIPDWLQPRLGEPLPPALVEWGATQPSLEAALAVCERADWRIWLHANNAATHDAQRRVLSEALACAALAGVIPLRTRPWWRGICWPWYSAREMAKYWSYAPDDDGDVGSDLWLSDLFNALLFVGVVGIAAELTLRRRGWRQSSYELVGSLMIALLVPVVRRAWRLLRRGVNRGRLRRFTFERGWRMVRPLLDDLWERASPTSRQVLLRRTSLHDE